MMKLILLFLLAVVVILGAYTFKELPMGQLAGKSDEPAKMVKVDALPWQVEVLDDERVNVLGIVLGESTVWHAIQVWNARPDVGLFQGPDQQLRLEAFFGKVKIGVFDAYVVARLGVSDEDMLKFNELKLERSPMPSGDYKYELPEKQLSEAHDLKIVELTYVPVVDYDRAIVEQRFGTPEVDSPLAEGRELLLYPEKSLAIILDENDKDILHYVTPSRFSALTQRIEAAQAEEKQR